MDEEIDDLVVRVRADRQAFARDVEAMRGTLEGPLASGAERAGRRIEQGLLRAVRTGQFGFEELKAIALRVLDDIAANALRAGIGSIGGD
ncbi:tail tape measure protein, partial [Sphingomonas sp. BHC-A]